MESTLPTFYYYNVVKYIHLLSAVNGFCKYSTKQMLKEYDEISLALKTAIIYSIDIGLWRDLDKILTINGGEQACEKN